MLLAQCTAGAPLAGLPTNLHSAVGSTANATDEAVVLSAANSVIGTQIDAASQYSGESAVSAVVQRRQLFAALRHNLMQIMVTMDEKNHVINNANEELSRHIRRLDAIHPHLTDEISEEARLGSLKHWAYTETNPTKKNAPTNRREAAANLALLHENEVAQRSESRREAVAAKAKNRLAQLDAGSEEIRTASKKTVAEGKRRAVDPDVAGLGITGASAGTAKRKKPEKSLASVAMEKSMSTALAGSRAMSREPSQQNVIKKRKAPATNPAVARKRYSSSLLFVTEADVFSRLNVNQDSPKLASSPLTSNFGKDAYKRSPALGSSRPVSSRARQTSAQVARPPSSASQRNANGVFGAAGQETDSRNTANIKETGNKNERFAETGTTGGPKGEASSRGGLLLERRASKPGISRIETIENDSKSVPSPRLSIATTNNARGRASKTSTPVVGTFHEAESTNGNGNGNSKFKRPARTRAKDHGLHDSLSPKGLPLKRSHKKGAGLLVQQHSHRKSASGIENITPPDDDVFSPSADISGSPGNERENKNENEHEAQNSADEALETEAQNSADDAIEGEGENEGEDEETYCYCGGPSYGEMVACDNDDCPRQWFHIECLGLKTVPKSASWFCGECKSRSIGSGNGHGGGGGNGGGNGGGGGGNGGSGNGGNGNGGRKVNGNGNGGGR